MIQLQIQQMEKRSSLFLLFALIVSLISCRNENSLNNLNQNKPNPLKYATGFKLWTTHEGKIVEVISGKKTIKTYVHYRDVPPVNLPSNSTLVKIPVTKVAALSSIYVGFLDRLNETRKIVAIDNIDYISNQKVHKKYNEHLIKQIAPSGEINCELAIQTNPDVIFMYENPGREMGVYANLTQHGIPVVTLNDHLETHPLGRAEWIKFLACFFDKESEADSLFSDTEKEYQKLKNRAHHAEKSPSVFTELKLNDAWYVPGGKSFMAQLLKDAKSTYCWENDSNTGSLPLSFETVFSKAVNSDYWLNVLFCKTSSDLLKLDLRYGQFYAFKTKSIYNNDLKINKSNANDYWETGLTQPDLILHDLITIFHPELMPGEKNYFYRKLP